MATTAVKDVMTPQPTAISSDATVVEAARRMSSEDVGSLPVVDGDKLRWLRSIIHLELAGVVLILLMAALMAKGIGMMV